MSKFTLICQEELIPFADVTASKRTVEFDADSLDQILNEFELFLRGCGFNYNGRLVFSEETCYETDDLDDLDSLFDGKKIIQSHEC
jgi:hypothetical protein